MHDDKKMAGPDLITSIVFIAVGAWIMHASLAMKVFRRLIISPGLFPAILGGTFIFFGVVIFIMAAARGGFGQARRILSAEYLAGVWNSPRFRRGMIVFGLILLYVLLFGNPWLAKLNTSFIVGNEIIPLNFGFFITTGGYLFCTFTYLRAMRRRTAIVVSLLTAVAVFYAFNKGFGIPIP